jgi:hypothetical protein
MKKIILSLNLIACLCNQNLNASDVDVLAAHKDKFRIAAVSSWVVPVLGANIGPILNNLAKGLWFRQAVELPCFLQWINTMQPEHLLNLALDCEPLKQGFNQNIHQLQANPNQYIRQVMNDYFTGAGTCSPLVDSYMQYSQNSCPNSIAHQCSQIMGKQCTDLSRDIRKIIRDWNTFTSQAKEVAAAVLPYIAPRKEACDDCHKGVFGSCWWRGKC